MKTRRNLIQIWLLCAAMLQALTSSAQPVTQIAAGIGHSLFLKSDGSLWAVGFNANGQLGDGTFNDTNRPEQILMASNVTAIAAGQRHSLFQESDGSLWGVGGNEYGQLGDGNYGTYPNHFGTSRPEQIVVSNVIAISAGGAHSLFVKNDGSLWGMGGNDIGQLGDGTYNGTNRPEQILVASNVTAIAAGSCHSLFLKSDGSLWGMGYNYQGQLGDGNFMTKAPYGTDRPEQIVASNVTAIAAGGFHSLFLKSDGSLWAMGDNDYGQLGNGTFNNACRPELIVASNVTAIAGGGYHSLVLKSDGSLWGMGDNEFGELGDGTYSNAYAPEMIVPTGVKAIAAGIEHSLFLKSDGSLWGMGDNTSGELGEGNFNFTNRPVQILGPYNQISGQLLSGTKVQLSFVGVANKNYALDWSGSLSPANWIPQLTNPAGSFGALVFTNPPDAATNNFWRIRSVP